MPARCLTLIAVLFVVPLCVQGQTVTLQGTVSETVALSILPNFTQNNVDLNVVNNGSTVRLTLSSTGAEVRVPLLVRSNTGFKISVESQTQSETAVPAHLSVIDVRPTGSLVSAEIVNALVSSEVELNTSQPLLVLSGPRVSLGGTLNSSNNALQVTLLIRMQSQTAHGSLVHLTFTGTAAPLIP
jgi:hypothetical protein